MGKRPKKRAKNKRQRKERPGELWREPGAGSTEMPRWTREVKITGVEGDGRAGDSETHRQDKMVGTVETESLVSV